MKREIKFKLIIGDTITEGMTLARMVDASAQKEWSHCLQYTGFRDSQKEEIYEGDIVEIRFGPKRQYVIEWSLAKGRWIGVGQKGSDQQYRQTLDSNFLLETRRISNI